MATDFETTSAEEIQERLLTTESRRRPSAAAYLRYYLTHKPLGTVGFSIVLLMILLAIFAPLIAPYTYQEQNYEAIREAPNVTFFFGTDQFGRDIFSRVVYGARISMLVGFLAVIVGTGAGAVVGLISGYFMGKVDAVVQRFVDMWMSFPDLILALTIVAVFGNTIPNKTSGTRKQVCQGPAARLPPLPWMEKYTSLEARLKIVPMTLPCMILSRTPGH